MRNRYSIAPLALFAAALALAPTSSRAQWTQTAGPSGAVITAIAGSHDALFAMVYDDVYRFDPATAHWARTGSLAGDPLQFGAFGGPRLVLHDGALLATVRSGIARSTDGGATWLPTGLEGSLFRGGDELFALSGESIHRLEGGVWRSVGTVPPRTGLPTMLGSVAFTTTLYGNELFRSDDGMRTWRQVALDLPAGDREGTAGLGVMLAGGGDILYAVLGGAEIVRSRDGATWEYITGELPDALGARELFVDGDEVLINANDGLFRFDGARWSRVETGPVREVAFAGDRTVIATYGGLRLLGDDGRSTTSLNGDLVASGTWSLASIGTYVFAATSDGLHRTTDGGASWRRVADFTPWMQSAYAQTGRTLFAAAGALYRSADSGATWTMTGPIYDIEWEGPPYRTDITGIAAAGGTLYVGAGSYLSGKGASGWAGGGVWRSTDEGATWAEISAGLPHDGFTYAPVGSVVATPSYLLITNARGVYRSDDGGSRWRPSMTGLPVTSQYIGHGELFTLGATHYLRLGLEYYESADRGRSWRPMSVAAPTGYSWSGSALSVVDGRLYALASRIVDDTTFTMPLLRFDGRTWEDISATVPDGVTFQSFVRAGNHVYAGSLRNGVWRSDASPAPSGVAYRDESSVLTALATAPQPAGDALVVRFELADRSPVALRLVDARGTTVLSDESGALDAGSHERRIDLSTLPAGVYLLRADGDGWTRSTTVVRTR